MSQDNDIEIIPPTKQRNKRPSGAGSPNVWRLLYIIAAAIIVIWLLGVVLKFTAWLIGVLFPLAVLVIIVGLIYRYLHRR